MPRISAPTVAENREQRRAALLEAASAVMLRGGTVTVAEVAAQVGLSRSAVYEYCSSAGDLVADVLVEELAAWGRAMDAAIAGQPDPALRIGAWITAVLDYVADGRHALARAAAAVDLPTERRADVLARHAALVAPVEEALAEVGVADPVGTAGLVWGAVDAAIARIESGASSASDEAERTREFVRGGVERLSRG